MTFRNQSCGGLIAVLLLAGTLRAIAMWVHADDLAGDPDAYVSIARHLAAGDGFTSVGPEQPTAFRPWLYPAVLAVPLSLGLGTIGIGLVNLASGLVTVAVTVLWGRLIAGPMAGYLAGAIIAVEPLSLRYTPHPMTETLFAMLTTLLLWRATCCSLKAADLVPAKQPTPGEAASKGDARQEVMIGVLVGLAALCRPTIWAFVILVGLLRLVASRVSRWHQRLGLAGCRARIIILAAALMVSPWVVRNWLVFGQPIVMTTHGGYTLLLGNNPVFYSEVVAAPWGTVWGHDSLVSWQAKLEAELQAEVPPVEGEVARDRWMKARAKANIRAQPWMFVRSCCLRIARLWNPMPLTATGLPAFVVGAIGLFYVGLWLALPISLWILGRSRPAAVWPALLLILALTGVHTFYWSNSRMRIPAMPAVAVVVAAGITTGGRRSAQIADRASGRDTQACIG